MLKSRYFLAVLLAVAIGACRRVPRVQVPPGPAFRLLSTAELPDFEDRGDRDSMLRALDFQLAWLEGEASDELEWDLGSKTYDREDMLATLRRFREIWLENNGQSERLRQAIAREFDVLQLEFNGRADILFTGYFSPIYSGSLERDDTYRFPLYALPDDLISIRPSSFHEKFLIPGTAVRDDRIMARFDPGSGQVVSFYTREQIDREGALDGRGLELVYLRNYMDAFLFHVQGGGFLRLPDGHLLKLDFAGKNGHPYRSIGRMLVDEGVIPAAGLSLPAVLEHLDSHPQDLYRVCYANPSYVFYKSGGILAGELEPAQYPNGRLGFPVTTGRSIATDKRYFPGGALAFVRGTQNLPGLDGGPVAAFVIDQDTGGAIVDDHIDVFMGAGPEAGERAGLLNDRDGRVYFLVLKK